MANHWQILVRSIQCKSYYIMADATGVQSMTMFTGFEEPLRVELEQYKRTVSVRVRLDLRKLSLILSLGKVYCL